MEIALRIVLSVVVFLLMVLVLSIIHERKIDPRKVEYKELLYTRWNLKIFFYSLLSNALFWPQCIWKLVIKFPMGKHLILAVLVWFLACVAIDLLIGQAQGTINFEGITYKSETLAIIIIISVIWLIIIQAIENGRKLWKEAKNGTCS